MPESLGNLTLRREGQFYKLKVIPSKVKLKEKSHRCTKIITQNIQDTEIRGSKKSYETATGIITREQYHARSDGMSQPLMKDGCMKQE